jgi:hypothetical protein
VQIPTPEELQRLLRLVRNLPVGNQKETSELRLGYRVGSGDSSVLPDPTNMRSGIIDCSVPPCGPNINNYEFMIDRLSDDGDTVFAHYSYELQFILNGDYSLFFDGCCRPGLRTI